MNASTPPSARPTLLARPTRLAAVILVIAAARFMELSAQQDLKEIPAPDTNAEIAQFEVADGFEINLFAADPLVLKPIQMNFDAAGRLWIATSPIYPQLSPGSPAQDKVYVIEDTDGDGVADHSTVFADDLLIPTAVVPGDGGAYVANSTELIHLEDTDGDMRADTRRTILSGFGTEDTHHILHTLRWGPGGFLYFNQSIYIHSHIETPHGVRRLYAGGVWQFRPKTMELEVFARGMVNGWAHQFDRWGQSFGADGAYHEGVIYFVPGASYFTAYGARRILHGLNLGSPKHCGGEIVGGRHLPDDWQGNFITCDFRANRVNRFALSDSGAGYRSAQKPDLVRSKNVAFRPIDVKMGPDGAIYIADWYNPIIQHGEVDFRDARRNHEQGRIWRLRRTDRALVKPPTLVNVHVRALLDHLQAPEYWTRHRAKRVLSGREPKTVLPALAHWIDGLDSQDREFEHHLLEALWMYQTLDVANEELLVRLLTAREPRARTAATRVLKHWRDRVSAPLDHLERLARDPYPRVRLEAVRALGLLGSQRAAEIALGVMERPMDPFLEYSLWLTVNDLVEQWLPAMGRGETVFGNDPLKLEFALTAVGSNTVADPIRRLLTSGGLPAASTARMLELVAQVGAPDDLQFVFERVRSPSALDDSTRAALIGSLARAAKDRKQRIDAAPALLQSLLSENSDKISSAALRLAGAWKVEALRGTLEAEIANSARPRAVRLAAIDGLVDLGGADTATALNRVSSSDTDRSFVTHVVAGLVRIDAKLAAEKTVELLARDLDGVDPAVLFQAFFARQEGAEILRAALQSKELGADVARIGLRQLEAFRVDAPELSKLFESYVGAGAWAQVLDGEMLGSLVREVRQIGDPVRGESVYRRKKLDCLNCHAIGGAGGQVGPDLTSLGGAAQPDYILEALVVPNKAVKENYHANIVVTNSGEVITGIPIAESNESLTLRTAGDEEKTVPITAIQAREVSGSIMPTGLVDGLTRAELVDLARFLGALGKAPGFTVERTPLARRWRLLENPAPELILDDPQRVGDILPTRPWIWRLAYSRTDGVLPRAELDRLPQRWPVTFARADLEVAKAGTVTIRCVDPGGLTLWLGRRHVALDSATGEASLIDVTQDAHELVVRVEMEKHKGGLRLELIDSGNSAAQVRFVGGR